MSDTGQNRFEIDLDEIERQLRRSAELGAATPAPQSDPLAELARIVGQDDPFLNILGDGKKPGAAKERQEPTLAPAAAPARELPRSQTDAVLTAEDRSVLGTAPAARDDGALSGAPEGFDPVARSYGREAESLDGGDFSPLEAPRSRRRLGAVMAVVALGGVGLAGAYAWRNMGGNFAQSGPPPLIKADNAPLKVAPENPGGMDIPNQNKQILEGRTESGRSRVLDRQEQPIDVREAARQMPQPEPALPPPVAAPQQGPVTGGSPVTAQPGSAAPPAPADVASAPPAAPSDAGAVNATVSPPAAVAAAPRNQALSALGEPRRVRTVAVRPDGTPIGASGGLMVSDPNLPALFGSAPPPVSRPTVSIPANPASPPQPAAAPPPVAEAPPPSATPGSDGTPPPTATPVQVLPPSRPRSAAVAAAEPEPVATGAAEQGSPSLFQPADVGRTDANDSPAPAEAARGVSVRPPSRPARLGQQVAATDSVAELPEQATGATSARTYAVQLAVRPSEEAARAAYDQLADRFATDLGGKPATVTQGQVNGRTVFRVRVTPLSREDANTLCTRLKSSGGQCFVVAN